MRRRKNRNLHTDLFPFELSYTVSVAPSALYTVPIRGWVDWEKLKRSMVGSWIGWPVEIKIVRQ